MAVQGCGKEWGGPRNALYGASGLQHPPVPLLPSALTKLSALCKSPRVAPGLKGRPFRRLQSWSQAQCWQPRPVLGRGGRGVLCHRQMFLFSSADGARRASESADEREWRGSPRGCEPRRCRWCQSSAILLADDFDQGRCKPFAAREHFRCFPMLSDASRPSLLSLCPFSNGFFRTPPPATPCDFSPARMLLLTLGSCGSWFSDP